LFPVRITAASRRASAAIDKAGVPPALLLSHYERRSSVLLVRTPKVQPRARRTMPPGSRKAKCRAFEASEPSLTVKTIASLAHAASAVAEVAQHSEELMRADRRPARAPAADDAIAGYGNIRGAPMASLSMAEPAATRPGVSPWTSLLCHRIQRSVTLFSQNFHENFEIFSLQGDIGVLTSMPSKVCRGHSRQTHQITRTSRMRHASYRLTGSAVAALSDWPR
jgi:hypothetical protein